MKRCLAILSLFVILFQSTSQLLIIGSFYYNRKVISETICVNRFERIPLCKGQCYLTKELKENEKKSEKFPDLKQKQINLFLEHTMHFTAFSSVLSGDQPFHPSTDLYLNDYRGSVFHPPQLA